MARALSLDALAAAEAVGRARHDPAVLASVAFLTHTLSVHTAPPLETVVRTGELGAVVSVETNIASALPVYTLASAVAVVGAC